MRVIAISNQKGGTGKTTSAVNIGFGLQRLGYQVLIIDMDPQANLSTAVGISMDMDKNLYHLFKPETEPEEVMQEVRGVKIIPAGLELSLVEGEYAWVRDKEYMLKNIMTRLQDFDFVLLDCPPSLGLLTLNALTAANEVFIPVQTEFLALQGMSKLLETLEYVKNKLNPDLVISGIIAVRYDKRKVLNREVVAKLELHFKDKLYKNYIRDNISLAEAPSFGLDIYHYKADSAGAADYRQLCLEIIERSKK